MSRVFFFIIFVSGVILVLGSIQLLLLRLLNRDWWRRRWIRRASWMLPLAGVVFFLLTIIGEYYNHSWLVVIAAPLAALAVVLEISLMFSLPVSGAIQAAGRLWRRLSKAKSEEVLTPGQRKRRLFLKGAAAAVPMSAVAAGLGGLGRAYGAAQVEKKVFRYKNLSPQLDGLKILHLSDIHLRHYITLDDLEQVVLDAEKFSPDLVLVTGDVADDLKQLPDALKMIDGLRPRLGCYASLGNHEYFRGIVQVRREFDRSPVHLLVNERARIETDGSRFDVAGIDDPLMLLDPRSPFFGRCLDNALGKEAVTEFTVLMTHRPDGFPAAVERGVHLSLAGHTHGGQVGWFGRSLLENAFPQRYLWGHYRKGENQLYTTSGVGHWFPFRLGCPREAPIIQLKSAQYSGR
jgi:predicted MPP superfamily phosphohydrolase